MIFLDQILRNNTILPACFVIVMVALMSGCATDPSTGRSTLDPKLATFSGALLGAAGGAAIGHIVGGKDGMAIGAAIGAGVGGLAGYTVNNYLSADEQQQYDTNLNQRMKTTPVGSSGSGAWVNVDQSKSVNTIFSQGIPLQQAVSQLGARVSLNRQLIATLPSDTVCRVENASFQVDRQQATNPGIFCREVNGDYVRINSTGA